MKKLIELIKIVTKEKTKRVNIIGQEKNEKKSLTRRLYEEILAGKIKTDEEAGNLLYGEDFDPNTYIRTKYRLEEKLINSLFFINLNEPHYSDLQKNYYKCNKDMAAVKFLVGKSARNTGIHLAEKTIRQAIKYEFTEIILELGRILKRHYRILSPNKEKATHYINIVTHYKKILELEILAEDFREEISTNSRATQSFQKDKVTEYENILRKHLENFSSFKLKLNYYLIAILKYRVINDHENVISVCKEGIKYFEKEQRQKSTPFMTVFYLESIISCIGLKKFKRGEQFFHYAKELAPNGSINRFNILDSYTLLCFHTQNYRQAYTVISETLNHKKYTSIHSKYQEIWKVYNAYSQFLIANGTITLPKEEKKNFRLAKFLNEVPQYSKDKQGTNISILILQILFLLHRKDREAIIERMEALKQYSYRYLIKDETLRSNCFIKMLGKMVKVSFHKNATIRTTKRLYSRLAETPSATKGHSQFVEIIPYEILWEIVLSKLTNRVM